MRCGCGSGRGEEMGAPEAGRSANSPSAAAPRRTPKVGPPAAGRARMRRVRDSAPAPQMQQRRQTRTIRSVASTSEPSKGAAAPGPMCCSSAPKGRGRQRSNFERRASSARARARRCRPAAPLGHVGHRRGAKHQPCFRTRAPLALLPPLPPAASTGRSSDKDGPEQHCIALKISATVLGAELHGSEPWSCMHQTDAMSPSRLRDAQTAGAASSS
jgi:hypothetical protein